MARPDVSSAHAEAEFRFYEELNDFLPEPQRRCSIIYSFKGTPSVKDTIEAIGVPHTEIDLILIDGESVDFSHRLVGGERVAVYPMFERLDIASATRLRARPLRHTRFVLDVHLGRLARYLRMVGFDTLYAKDFDDHQIVALSVSERRIILTRDKGLLKHRAVTHGYWLRETDPRRQLLEVLDAFYLRDSLHPFSRCIICNGELANVAKEIVNDLLPPRVRASFECFKRCTVCAKVYWPGSHFERMQRLIETIVSGDSTSLDQAG